MVQRGHAFIHGRPLQTVVCRIDVNQHFMKDCGKDWSKHWVDFIKKIIGPCLILLGWSLSVFVWSKYVRLYAWTTSLIERSMFLYQWSLWFNRTKYRCASVRQPWQTVVVRHRTQTCPASSAHIASRQSTSIQRRRAIDMRIACKDSSVHVHRRLEVMLKWFFI